MIKLRIVSSGKKIETDFLENAQTLSENSLVIRELERIKLELLGTEFKLDLGIKEEDA